MPPRWLTSLAGLALAVASATATEPEVLAEGLDRPTALVVAPGPEGGVSLVSAEADGLVERILLGESVLSRKPLTGSNDRSVAGLASYGGRLLMLGSGGLAGVDDSGPGEGPAVTGAPALDDRWLYAPGESSLLRCRLGGGRVTLLRPVGPEGLRPVAVAFAPEGYLAVLTTAEHDSPTLAFFDPADPEASIVAYPATGLTGPIALTYAGDSLYALAGGEAAGLYRLMVEPSDDGVRAAAERVAAIEEPIAITAGPRGELYVATATGRLLRFDDP